MAALNTLPVARVLRDPLAWLLLVVVVSRLALLPTGGPFFFPDENEYKFISRAVAGYLLDGRWEDAVRLLLLAPYFMAKVFGLLPALLERALGESDRIPWLFYNAFAVANMFLLHRIALAAGAGRGEALLATALLAFSATHVYAFRHVLPYDLAIFFGLLAVWLLLKPAGGLGRQGTVGGLCALLFWCYNGYWPLVVLAWGMSLWYCRASSWRTVVLSQLAWASGFLLPLGVALLAAAATGFDFIGTVSRFQGSINQGNHAEGWWIPLVFFWHTDHAIVFAWLAALLASLLACLCGRACLRVGLACVAVLVIYGCLAVFSVVLEKFVVYGRLTKPLVPFLCLLLAFWLCRLAGDGWKKTAAVLVSLYFIQAAYNLYGIYRVEFPESFIHRANAWVEASGGGGQYALVDAEFISDLHNADSLQETRPVVLRAVHPQKFIPYLYEGFPPAQRAMFIDSPVSMLLVRTDAAGNPPAP